MKSSLPTNTSNIPGEEAAAWPPLPAAAVVVRHTKRVQNVWGRGRDRGRGVWRASERRDGGGGRQEEETEHVCLGN